MGKNDSSLAVQCYAKKGRGGAWHACCVRYDLMTSGRTLTQAKERLQGLLQFYIDRSLYKGLIRHGSAIKDAKARRKMARVFLEEYREARRNPGGNQRVFKGLLDFALRPVFECTRVEIR